MECFDTDGNERYHKGGSELNRHKFIVDALTCILCERRNELFLVGANFSV